MSAGRTAGPVNRHKQALVGPDRGQVRNEWVLGKTLTDCQALLVIDATARQ